MTELMQHPLSAAFPAMSAADLSDLTLDIERHGVHEPIVLLEGMVLDGWHRYRAAQQCGTDCPSREFDDDDPVAYVISKNLHRRHLTATQRAVVVVSCFEWLKRGERNIIRTGADLKDTNNQRVTQTSAELANSVQVGTRTVEQVKAAIRGGLGDAMRDGQISAKAAAHLAGSNGADPDARRAKSAKPPKSPEPDDAQQLEAAALERAEDNQELEALAVELHNEVVALRLAVSDDQKALAHELMVALGNLEVVTRRRDDLMNENAQLKREVKKLLRQLGRPVR